MTLEEASSPQEMFLSRSLDRDRWARQAWSNAKFRARRDGRPFKVTVEWLMLNAPVCCPVLGMPLSYGPKGSQGPRSDSATLDRIDNTLGYVPGNLVIISGKANRIKYTLNLVDIRTLARTRVPGLDDDDFSRMVLFFSRL